MAGTADGTRARISWLWVFVMLNMIFADILGFMKADFLRQLMEGRAEQITITPMVLLLIAVVTEIPIAMVVLSQVLPQRVARWGNVVAAVLTAAYVIGGGYTDPHYIFIAGLETVACLFIGWTAWTWREAVEVLPAADLVAG